MLAAGATGSTGMQQSHATQKNIYNDLTQSQGAASKALANAAILDKCWEPMLEDEEHTAYLKSK
jgi:hypothetical protein